MKKYIAIMFLALALFLKEFQSVANNKKPHINNATYHDLVDSNLDFIKEKRIRSIVDNAPYKSREDLIKRSKIGESTARILEQKYEI